MRVIGGIRLIGSEGDRHPPGVKDKYRVIYSDLRAEEVEDKRLAELEALKPVTSRKE